MEGITFCRGPKSSCNCQLFFFNLKFLLLQYSAITHLDYLFWIKKLGLEIKNILQDEKYLNLAIVVYCNSKEYEFNRFRVLLIPSSFLALPFALEKRRLLVHYPKYLSSLNINVPYSLIFIYMCVCITFQSL